MDLLSMLLSSMTSNSSVEALSKKSGGSSKAVKTLLLMAIPLIIRYMTKNAKESQQGATSLLGALQQHTSTQPVTNQISNADATDGAAILGHVFGNDYNSVVQNLASQSGLTQTQASSVLQNLAPALMSGLSAATSSVSTQSQNSGFNLSDGLDLSDIAALWAVARSHSSSHQVSPECSEAFSVADSNSSRAQAFSEAFSAVAPMIMTMPSTEWIF